jgi:hypothetical protein
VKSFLIFIFALGAFWDFATSFLGIVGLFGVTQLSLSDMGSMTKSLTILISAVIGSLIILALSLNTEEMWDENADNTYKLLRPFHVSAIVFDAYTSYLGTAQNILLRESHSAYITIGVGEVWEKLSFEQQILLLFITALITSSPIMISKLRG